MAEDGQYDDNLKFYEILALGTQAQRGHNQVGTNTFRIYVIDQIGQTTYLDQYAVITLTFNDCCLFYGTSFRGKLFDESAELLRTFVFVSMGDENRKPMLLVAISLRFITKI